MELKNHPELPPEKLRWKCPESALPFETTNEVPACVEILGQHRALAAIRLGLEIKGYHIFVTGMEGTGRSSSIKCALEEMEREGVRPEDLCFVNNFKDPDQPRFVSLPAGTGRGFKKDMEDLLDALKKKIPAIFESEEHQKNRQQFMEGRREAGKVFVKDYETRVKKEGFALVQVQLGAATRPDVLPLIAGNPMSFDQLETLVDEGQFSKETFAQLKGKYTQLSMEMEQVLKETGKMEKNIQEGLSQLDKNAVYQYVHGIIEDLRRKYENLRVGKFLDELKENILGNPARFQPRTEIPNLGIPGLAYPQPPDLFTEYQVNLLVDNSEAKGPPVVIENNPTYRNLFGTIERSIGMGGMMTTDFTKIRAGSLFRANGGYLVLNALDTATEPGVWVALKRALKNNRLEMQSFDPFYLFASSALKPEAIDVHVKVVMIGDNAVYQALHSQDEDFRKIFKIRAEFDTVMNRTPDAVLQYSSFIQRVCREEKLLPFDRTGVARVIEFGLRLGGRQTKLSTEFNRVKDILREADYWAKKEKSERVGGPHVERAISERIYRRKMIQEKIQEMIRDGVIMIDSKGAKVGQVNGLSVISLGEYAFGQPSRITATTAVGKPAIINIEREADLSGPSHNKGVLILGGYLRGRYAQDKPLVLTASIAFEHSYSGVDGDSASSTEVCAILSSLAGLPLRQDIAVTGSVNQKGEIQPIGGVNQKIEGFFDVCRLTQLTGTQGVMIPHQNVEDLMLRNDVVAAVAEGKFHIYAVKTIDEGIELLTGLPAGAENGKGTFPEGTVNYLINEKLAALAQRGKAFDEKP